MQQSNYQILIQKLDEFIRKYYINHLIRGTLYSVAILGALFIMFSVLEHYVFTSSISSIGFRKTLFYSFLGISGLSLGWLIFRPLVNYFKLGKVISHEQAAGIVGNHFTNVKDKLLNVLQLKQQANFGQTALIQASIDQKIATLKPVPFQTAIDLSENKKYLRYALPPLLLLLLLVLLFPGMITNSTKRILNNNKEFERDALFKFIIPNGNAQIVQYESYELEVTVEGEALPSEVFIEVDNFKYKLEKVTPNTFKYNFVELREDTEFRLTANSVTSKGYTIDVLEKPEIEKFDVKLNYPAYTGRKDESVKGVGDLVVPAGTNIDWLFESVNTDDIKVQFSEGGEPIAAQQSGEKLFSVKKKVTRDGQYKVFMTNKQLPQGDSITYSITVIPDLYPAIEVQKYQDSLNDKIVYFAGEASDDYGLRSLKFNYKVERSGQTVKEDILAIPFTRGKQTTYEHILNVKELELKPGDKLSYYFQVYDNDAVQGSKSAKTPVMYYEMPTIEEVKEQEQENNKEIKTDLESAMKNIQKLSRNVKKAKEQILQKEELNWQDRRELEKLIEQQKELQKQMQKAEENFKENKKNQEEYQKVNEEIQEKQEKLQELFDKIMNDEMKELFEQMQNMLDDLNKEDIMEQLENIEMNDEELEKELDRMMELFKKMEVEKEMTDAIQELDSLAKEQEKLAEQTDDSKKENAEDKDKAAEDKKENGDKENEDKNAEENGDKKDGADKKKESAADKAKQEELKKKQEEINKKFEELEKKMEEIRKKNDELDDPFDMEEEDMEMQEQEIQENLENSSEQLDQKKNKSASKSQKNAAKKMKQMSKKMKEQMKMEQMKKMEEDLRAMRQLLENLVSVSFDQEELIDEVNKTIPNTPTYVRLVQRQHKLQDDFRHVEDSLQALSKRVFQLQSFINEKVTEVKRTLAKSLETLEERQKRTAVVQQQYTMKGVNDLALMLSESMNQMQQQMAQQMPGSQMCEKPGDGKPGGKGQGEGQGPGSKPGFGGMKEMQQKLSEQLKQMQEQMKNGKMPGKGKGGMSQKFAQMAAQQAAIRKAMQDMKNKKQGKGKDGGKDMQEMIDAMDKIETDLVNKRFPNDMLKRQQDIITRLLEAENAEREREYDEKREAEKPKEFTPKMPPALEEYLKKRKGQVEMFKTVSPSLKPYYKNLVEKYFRALN